MYEFYLFSLISALGLLVLWQTFGKVKSLSSIFGSLFLLSIVTYGISLFQLHLNDFYSLKIVFRDLMMLSFASFASIISRRSKLVMLSWLLISGFAVFTLYQNREVLIPKDFSLESEGELFLKMKSPGTISNLELIDYLNSEEIAFELAFDLKNVDQSELDNYFVLDLKRSDPIYINQVKKHLNGFQEIELLEENEEIYLSPMVAEDSKPNNKSINFNDPLSPQQWALKALKVNELHDLLDQNGAGYKKAKLFILDTGVDAEHEDLRANYKSYKKVYDTDTQSHGTHCAGIAGAVSNNKKGVSSMSIDNSRFTISGIKVLNDYGVGNQKKIIDGIIAAAEDGADVISLSLGGRSTDKRQKLYEETVAYANSLGSIVIVAAGNSSMNAKDYSPANTKGVIAVAAIDENLNMATFSNSVESLEMGISAPGVNILSTVPQNGYKSYNGTSMATPYVAGLAALMKSLDPNLTTQQLFLMMDSNGQTLQQSKSGNLINPVKTVKELLK